MSLITDIAITQYDFDLANEKKQLLELGINLDDFLPTKPQYKVDFVINRNTSFANYVRCLLLSGVPMWGILRLYNYNTDDKLLLYDDMENGMQKLGIYQTPLAEMKDAQKKLVGTLFAHNTTSKMMTVTTAHITWKYDGVEVKEPITSNQNLLILQSGKKISFDIEVSYNVAGTKMVNSHNALSGNPIYRCLDAKAFSKGGPKSGTYIANKYAISYKPQRVFDDPLEVIQGALHTMLNELVSIGESLDEIKNDIFESPAIKYNKIDNVIQLTFRTCTVQFAYMFAQELYLHFGAKFDYIAPNKIDTENVVVVTFRTHLTTDEMVVLYKKAIASLAKSTEEAKKTFTSTKVAIKKEYFK